MIVIHAVKSYDGTSLHSIVEGAPRLIFRCVRGLYEGYEVRGSDSIVPRAEGRVAQPRVRDRVPIELEGEVFGIGDTEAQQRADIAAALTSLRTLFRRDRDATTLVVEREDGDESHIEARPLNIVYPDRAITTYAKLSVELEAIGDDWVTVEVGS